jgi:hypothetical protein
MKLHISKGNMKLGNIPNLSLPPIETCAPHLPCFEKCYARKAYRCYPSARSAWDENLKLWQASPSRFILELSSWLSDNKPKYFRWHVGGDIPDEMYLKMMIAVAEVFRETKFLAYTKKLELFAHVHLPDNLMVILSRWPDDKFGGSWHRQAWMLNPEHPDTRIPETVFECPGTCDNCKFCFDGQGDVVFKKH